jgi:hypothetical protein
LYAYSSATCISLVMYRCVPTTQIWYVRVRVCHTLYPNYTHLMYVCVIGDVSVHRIYHISTYDIPYTHTHEYICRYIYTDVHMYIWVGYMHVLWGGGYMDISIQMYMCIYDMPYIQTHVLI